ncbi:MAG: hypothetical protein FWC23_05860 [Chitinispirillia bacterium]|nr:hypothetical protein [Chitinispirillia bacterium]MCL2268693.1 hypothetical protein [Chitinispirillia bacterium]
MKKVLLLLSVVGLLAFTVTSKSFVGGIWGSVVSGKDALMWAPVDVPVEVALILDNYVRDSAARNGPLDARMFGALDKSVPVSDLVVGTPVPKYMIQHFFLNARPDTVPFYEIIEPADEWYAPVLVNGKPQYELGLHKSDDGKWEISSLSTPPVTGDNMWDLLSEFYPESRGISPVYFTFGHERYLYFPQLGPRKIYYLKYGTVGVDPLATLFPGTIDALDDSKMVMAHWKAQGLDEVKGFISDEDWCRLAGNNVVELGCEG